MYYVSAFCQRALWLRSGRVAALGPVSEVVREYENFLVAKSAQAAEGAVAEAVETPRALPARLGSVRLLAPELLFTQGDPWELEVEWETEDPRLAFHLGVGINPPEQRRRCSFTHLDGHHR